MANDKQENQDGAPDVPADEGAREEPEPLILSPLRKRKVDLPPPPSASGVEDVPAESAEPEGVEPVADPEVEVPAEPELMDTLPVTKDGALKQAPQEGQLLEACPACGTLMDVTDHEPFAKIHCPSCGQALRARKQFNHYRLLELIGQGGMGQVFKAMDCNLNRTVALKVLKKELASSPEEREKLANESRITASINHPHVVKVFSFGQDHGQFYMAMELVPNASLDDLLALQRRVPEAQVLEVGIQIAQGLEAALNLGLIHRDIKPGNILFADAHTAKLVDFGLAIVMDEAAASIGEIWGTPYYIAPEKLDNQAEDFRSDIYSLGGTLFHALAGRPPYEADTASMVALKQLKSQAVSLQAFAPEVSSETSYVINRMIAKNPEERYGSYQELIEHLTYARGKLLERIKNPPLPKARVVLENKETRNFAALISLGLLLTVGLAGFAVFHFRESIFPPSAEKRESFSESDFDSTFAEAVGFAVEMRYEEARDAFAGLTSQTGVPQPRLNWARMNGALASLLAGDKDSAAKIFAAIKADGLYTQQQPGVAVADFFVEVSRQLSSAETPIDPRTAALFSKTDFEVFALLCFGIHNWQLGDIKAASPFLRSFISAKKSPPENWILSYQKLAAIYEADAKLVLDLQRKVDLIKSPADAQKLAPEVDNIRSLLQTGDRASEKLDAIAEAIQKAGG